MSNKSFQKALEIEDFLSQDFFGADRAKEMEESRCVSPEESVCPDCKGPAVSFKDALSRKEFGSSGLCQKCQDFIFGLERFYVRVNACQQ